MPLQHHADTLMTNAVHHWLFFFHGKDRKSLYSRAVLSLCTVDVYEKFDIPFLHDYLNKEFFFYESENRVRMTA